MRGLEIVVIMMVLFMVLLFKSLMGPVREDPKGPIYLDPAKVHQFEKGFKNGSK